MKTSEYHIASEAVAPKKEEVKKTREKQLEQAHQVSLSPENDPLQKPAKNS